jgi:hypothetical protein
MVSENINLYTVITALAFKKENGKENHGQTYAHLGAMGLKLWGSLASKLAAYPIALAPHLWWQACP